jgi:dihydrofolate reductase
MIRVLKSYNWDEYTPNILQALNAGREKRMGRIILSIPITVDGFIEGPHRELDWVIADDDLHDFYTDLLKKADLILYGRVTYDLMVSYWPTADSDPSVTPAMRRFAATLNPMKKIVFSTSLKNVGWNTQVYDRLIPKDIKKMKTETNSDILLGGGAAITQAFMQHGLVDEYQLMVQPTAIGEGKRLFEGIGQSLKLKYRWSKTFQSGAVALCYQPDGKV